MARIVPAANRSVRPTLIWSAAIEWKYKGVLYTAQLNLRTESEKEALTRDDRFGQECGATRAAMNLGLVEVSDPGRRRTSGLTRSKMELPAISRETRDQWGGRLVALSS